MATYTPNINLKKPNTAENFSTADINANSDKIDTTMFNKVDKVAGKSLVADSIMTDLTDLGDSSAHYHSTDRNTDNHTDGTTNKVFSATEKTKLAGIETGAEVNNISNANATDLTDSGDTTLHKHDRYADKLMATNLVTNGDFSNGTTGWSVYGGQATHIYEVDSGQYYAKRTSLGENLSIGFPFIGLSGHKFYVSGKFASNTNINTTNLMFIDTQIEIPTFNLTPAPTRFSNVVTLSLNSNLFILFNNFNLPSVNDDVAVDNILMIDLTTLFGAGNEPTKEQMDWIFTERDRLGSGHLNGTQELLPMVSLLNLINKLDDEKASKTQEAWITPTLLNGWTADICRYRKTSIGQLEIDVLNAKNGTSGYSLFEFINGYRIPLTRYYQQLIIKGFIDSASANISPYDVVISTLGATDNHSFHLILPMD